MSEPTKADKAAEAAKAAQDKAFGEMIAAAEAAKAKTVVMVQPSNPKAQPALRVDH